MEKINGNIDSNRVLYYDVLNITACLAVLYLHCNTMVHTWAPGKNWIAALAIETVFFFAVPVFFMLSGATLMRYRNRYSTGVFVRKRLIRVGIPFIAWSFIAFSWTNISLGIWREPSSWNPLKYFEGLLNNTVEGTYWFFFPLFAIYLAIPVLSLINQNIQSLVYGATLAFLFQYCLPVIMKIFKMSWNADLCMPVLGGYLFYPVLGYLLATVHLEKKYRVSLYLATVTALVFKFGYTLYYSGLIHDVDRTFFDYRTFPAALAAASLFVYCKYSDFSWLAKHQKLLSKISGCSSGIYLIHNLLLSKIVFGVFGVAPSSIILRTAGLLLLYCCCLCIVLLLKKIPVIRKIVP